MYGKFLNNGNPMDLSVFGVGGSSVFAQDMEILSSGSMFTQWNTWITIFLIIAVIALFALVMWLIFRPARQDEDFNTLTVYGTTNLQGDVNIGTSKSLTKSLDVKAVDPLNILTINTNTIMNGNLNIVGDIDITGSTTFNGSGNFETLGVTGAANLYGNTNIKGTLGVTGASNLYGNVTMGGNLGVTGLIHAVTNGGDHSLSSIQLFQGNSGPDRPGGRVIVANSTLFIEGSAVNYDEPDPNSKVIITPFYNQQGPYVTFDTSTGPNAGLVEFAKNVEIVQNLGVTGSVNIFGSLGYALPTSITDEISLVSYATNKFVYIKNDDGGNKQTITTTDVWPTAPKVNYFEAYPHDGVTGPAFVDPGGATGSVWVCPQKGIWEISLDMDAYLASTSTISPPYVLILGNGTTNTPYLQNQGTTVVNINYGEQIFITGNGVNLDIYDDNENPVPRNSRVSFKLISPLN